ncbi:hypothetical protein DICSQDRAFT_172385 [Dichomitus squalens LYAD-421 SS1]|uniref:Uncharacterized protein n=1 Tax=Dichomitus squalens (strain LYAD-421) TaxID=732165 RepID=R7SS97_DICSQ|nr:uncharacterized protein DICSQDRAFT_172385 [Dichomitus squalens LYAD-421 SS1]EJF59064.1 hypothetical protein DICSQDRAFT_172385 [Dichomitus squalens LYAD-421 SS1]
MLHVVFTWFSILSPEDGGPSYIALFTEPMTAVLTSRFLLDLQEVNQRAIGRYSSGTQSISLTSSFAPKFISSLGSHIFPEEDDTDTVLSLSMFTIPSVTSYNLDLPAYTERGLSSADPFADRAATPQCRDGAKSVCVEDGEVCWAI